MSIINNCFNFVTEAKPPAAKPIKFANLDMEFHVPAAIDIKAITGWLLDITGQQLLVYANLCSLLELWVKNRKYSYIYLGEIFLNVCIVVVYTALCSLLEFWVKNWNHIYLYYCGSFWLFALFSCKLEPLYMLNTKLTIIQVAIAQSHIQITCILDSIRPFQLVFLFLVREFPWHWRGRADT